LIAGKVTVGVKVAVGVNVTVAVRVAVEVNSLVTVREGRYVKVGISAGQGIAVLEGVTARSLASITAVNEGTAAGIGSWITSASTLMNSEKKRKPTKKLQRMSARIGFEKVVR
jgi:hypothetical protein